MTHTPSTHDWGWVETSNKLAKGAVEASSPLFSASLRPPDQKLGPHYPSSYIVTPSSSRTPALHDITPNHLRTPAA
eukprot:scaffold49678_cov26-Tisochrysis_lutea.AAC.1